MVDYYTVLATPGFRNLLGGIVQVFAGLFAKVLVTNDGSSTLAKEPSPQYALNAISVKTKAG